MTQCCGEFQTREWYDTLHRDHFGCCTDNGTIKLTKAIERGFIQQIIGAGAETHSQTLGRVWEILQKRSRKDCGSQRGQ